MAKRFTRSTTDKWLGGVCGGIAAHFDWDPLLVRIGWIVLTCLSFGLGVFAYLLLWILAPKS